MWLSLLLRSLRHSHSHSHSLISVPPTAHLRRSMATSTVTSAAETISPSNTRLGWIGTGVMGRSMCAHLINAGYALTIFTRTQPKAQPLLDMGAQWAPTPMAVAAQSDVVFSIVGYPSDVRHVLLHPSSGALSGLRPGGVLVDMTTSEPSLAVEIHSAAAALSCSSVDAPVSGGDRGAKNASLSIFAGGDGPTVRRLAPVFSLLGRVNYMGGPGKGQFAKLANQITIASTMVGLIEGLIYAHKAGLDLSLYLDAISTWRGRIEIAGSECENMGLALPGLALAQQLYLSLKAHGEGDLGTQALILALERLNNVSLEKA
ncbi:6-phosphogluconate dehydrogenase family protein [Actinidia rufa]|uniref:6-phosphogluconate dehydrogenase family protein n=1 Tax=Actinidia rufa TaxID=165716 RepID=A0A7J0DEN8_9ERIC|nr:6-phosphogluconate dehydrogenase family protein [Actinidia rufa]